MSGHSPVKIIIATPIYPPEIGGPATYTREIALRLKGTHEVTIVAYTDVPDTIPGVKLVAVRKAQSFPIRFVKYSIALWVASKDADLIYAQNAMAAGLPSALVSMLRGTPYALKFVGDEAWERATQHHLTDKLWEDFLDQSEGGLRIRLMMLIQGFVLRRARIVTTPSRYLIEELIRAYGIKRERTVVNYNAAEENEILPFAPALLPHQICTTARLIDLKKIDGIIEALAIVRRAYPDATLVIGGDGPEMERLKALRERLELTEAVTFLGRISRAETWQLRKRSGVYVLNSTHEGLPITVLTSFAAGIPMVATNVPGTNEAVYHEDTGLLIEPGDTDALAHAIERLFKDGELRERVIKNGLKILKEKFSWSAHEKILDSIFQSVRAEPGDVA